MSKPDTNKIRELNDRFRGSFLTGGIFVVTPGVEALPMLTQAQALKSVMVFDYCEDEPPYSEHDFGVFPLGDNSFFWKIDYYASPLDWVTGSEDPADPEKTIRVMTLMLAKEY